VNLNGTLNNAGATLNLGSGAGALKLTLVHGDAINNGTIADAGSGMSFAGGTLNGVTYQGTLDMSPSGSWVYITGGFNTSSSSPATVTLTGSGSSFQMIGNETIDNTIINIGASGATATLLNNNYTPTAVTLGSHVTVNQVGTNAAIASYNTGISSSMTNDGTINAGFAGGTFTIGSGVPLTFTNQGKINVSNGDTVTIGANSFTNTGTLIANGGNINITVAETGGGDATIYSTSEIEYHAASNENVSFAPGSTGTLRLDDSSAFTGTVAGLALNNYLDLADLSFQGNTTPSFTPNGSNGGTLAVTEGAKMVNIALLGTYLASSFVASSDGHGGTLITDPALTQQSQLTLPHA
jgi:hypothetical protein